MAKGKRTNNDLQTITGY